MVCTLPRRTWSKMVVLASLSRWAPSPWHLASDGLSLLIFCNIVDVSRWENPFLKVFLFPGRSTDRGWIGPHHDILCCCASRTCSTITCETGFSGIVSIPLPLGTVKLGRSWANYDRDFERQRNDSVLPIFALSHFWFFPYTWWQRGWKAALAANTKRATEWTTCSGLRGERKSSYRHRWLQYSIYRLENQHDVVIMCGHQ